MNQNRNVGIVLIALGLVIALLQLLGSNNATMWPLLVMLPGVVMLAVAVLGDKQQSALAIPGSIVSTVGAILWVQTLTGAFYSWAYAWALIVIAAGTGQWLQGRRVENTDTIREGTRAMQRGLAMFLIFGFFFEFVLGLGGRPTVLGSTAFPILLILAGVVMLLIRRQTR